MDSIAFAIACDQHFVWTGAWIWGGMSQGSATGRGERLPRSVTWWPRPVRALCKPATRRASGPMRQPWRGLPLSTGAPIRTQFRGMVRKIPYKDLVNISPIWVDLQRANCTFRRYKFRNDSRNGRYGRNGSQVDFGAAA